MTDLKLMTVRALRELAREHLGAGYSRLKTKAELVAALTKAMAAQKAAPAKAEAKPAPKAEPKPEAKTAAKVEAKPEPKPAAKPAKAEPKVEPKAAAKAPAKSKSRLDEIAAKYTDRQAASPAEARSPGKKGESAKPAAKAEPTKAEPTKIEPAKPAAKAAPKQAEPPPAVRNPVEIAHPNPASPKAPGAGAPEPTPLAAVAVKPAAVREDDDQLEAPSEEDAEELEAEEEAEAVAAEDEEAPAAEEAEEAPKPRKISPEEQALIDENLGELPFSYGDDAVVLQARDPATLWVYWDMSGDTWQRAMESRGGARPVLRLFDAGHLVREVEIALEAKSWYLYNVEAGRRYRAEVDLVAGREVVRRLGPVSNTTLVPNEGPSPVIDDRFVALPWEVPVQRAAELLAKPHPTPPFPPAQSAELLARAERALRDEQAVAAADAAAAAPGATVTERQVEGRGPEGERYVDVTVTRKLGASDTLTETFRRRLLGASDQIEANPRTRFGGRWSSSRPA